MAELALQSMNSQSILDLIQLRDIYVPLIMSIRQRRLPVEQSWLRNHRIWMARDSKLEYKPPDDSSAGPYNIPAARRAIERTAVRMAKLVMPQSKWFEVQGFQSGAEDSKTVSAVDNYMRYVLTKHIRSKHVIVQLCRTLLLYNMAILKTSPMVKNSAVWPFQRAVDPFMFYPFPETAADSGDVALLFEDMLMPKQKYDGFASKGLAMPILNERLHAPEWPTHIVERLAQQGISDPTAREGGVIDHGAHAKIKRELDRASREFVSLSEVWIPDAGRLYQMWLAWNIGTEPKVVMFRDSKYDEPLYRWAIHRPLPNETYTNSMMDDIAELNNLANDQISQTEDARRIVTNPPVGMRIEGQGRVDRYKYRPKAIWPFADDPREIMKVLDLPDTSTSGLRAWQISLSLINSLAGAGTIAEGQPGRNMPRAGFAVNSLINLGMSDVQDAAEVIEQDCLTKGLSDIYTITRTFIPESQIIRIPGTRGFPQLRLKPSDLAGDFEFQWVGSLQFQDTQLRAQRLLVFLNLLPQFLGPLQQQGYTINFADLIHMIWRDGLGERGFDDVIIPVQQGGQGNEQAMMQGGQGDVSSNGQSNGQRNVPGLDNINSLLPIVNLGRGG